MSISNYQELDESIYDMLEKIRRKPGMYIGERSINRLHAFLTGYRAGLGRLGFYPRDVDEFHRFHDWVANRLGFYESTSGWCNMIRDKSTSETEAFDQFFLFLDEFRKNAGVK
jgi:hypothetical protein